MSTFSLHSSFSPDPYSLVFMSLSCLDCRHTGSMFFSKFAIWSCDLPEVHSFWTENCKTCTYFLSFYILFPLMQIIYLYPIYLWPFCSFLHIYFSCSFPNFLFSRAPPLLHCRRPLSCSLLPIKVRMVLSVYQCWWGSGDSFVLNEGENLQQPQSVQQRPPPFSR